MMKIAIDISPLHNSQHNVRGVGYYISHLKNSLEQLNSSNTYTFFDRKIDLDNFDIIHYPYFDPFVESFSFKKPEKTIITIHDLTPLVLKNLFPAGVKGKIRWELQKRKIKRVKAIITDSESSKKDIVRFTGINEGKVHVVYLAPDSEYQQKKISSSRIEELRRKYHLPPEFILYVGDVTPNKNLPRLIQSIKEIKIPLVLVGKALVNQDYDKDNPWNNDLVYLQREAVGELFTTLGFVEQDELVDLYNMATVLVMPSLYEGFGLPVLEAMACGCPVITSKTSSLPEVAGNAAILIDPTSQSEISRKIQEVFANANLQQELTRKGLENIKKFSWNKTAKETNSVYESK